MIESYTIEITVITADDDVRIEIRDTDRDRPVRMKRVDNIDQALTYIRHWVKFENI